MDPPADVDTTIPPIKQFEGVASNNFVNAPILDVLKEFRRYLGKKIQLDPEIKDLKVHLNYSKELSWRQAMEVIRGHLYDQGVLMERVKGDKVRGVYRLPR